MWSQDCVANLQKHQSATNVWKWVGHISNFSSQSGTNHSKTRAGQVFSEEFFYTFFSSSLYQQNIYLQKSPHLNTVVMNLTRNVGYFIYNTAYPLLFIRVFCTHLWNGKNLWSTLATTKTRQVHRETPYNKLSITTFRSSAKKRIHFTQRNSDDTRKTLLWNYWMFKIQHRQYHREDLQNVYHSNHRSEHSLDNGM